MRMQEKQTDEVIMDATEVFTARGANKKVTWH
jgi:hypothetical protein